MFNVLQKKMKICLLAFAVFVVALVSSLFLINNASAENSSYGVAGQDYVAGQAIVCVQTQDQSLQDVLAETNNSDANVNGCEELMTLDTSCNLQKAIAIEDEDAITQLSVSESTQLSNLSSSENSNPCKIYLVNCANTANFLTAINSNQKILWAQPNYIRYAYSDEEYEGQMVNDDEPKEDLDEGKIEATEKSSTKTDTEKVDDESLSNTDLTKQNSSNLTQIETTNAVVNNNALTNDPMYDYQWTLDASMFGGNTNYDIDYQYLTGIEDTVVAVLDTGVAYDHEDISMWDEGLNYPILTSLGGGKYGYNGNTDETTEPQPSSDPYDLESGHGTHCASNIAAKTNNSLGTAGINANAKIMALRFLGNNGSGSDDGAIRCFAYMIAAKKAGVNVTTISNSWGSGPSNHNCPALEAVTTEAGVNGIMSVFAAGNDSTNLDGYPNNTYHNPYVVIVGASDSQGKSAPFSNYGHRTVDVYAPGTSMLCGTTERRGQYLPWVSSSANNYFYDNFESTAQATVSASYIDSSLTSHDVFVSTKIKDGTSYNKVMSADFSNAQVGDEFNVKINISKSTITEALSDPTYFACMYGMANMTQNGRIDFGYYDDYGQWVKLSDYGSYDSTMNVVSTKMNELLSLSSSTITIGFNGIIGTKSSNAEFWVDNVGLGKGTIKYTYMQGTSMACPAVSGVASVIAATTQKHTTADDVLYNISYVKGSSVPTGYLDDKCKIEGVVNLTKAYNAANSLTPETIMNPVMQSIEYGSDNKSATIHGNFFGSSQGTLSIDGVLATITNWQNTQITFQVPSGEEHLAKFTLTNTSGKSSSAYFEINKGATKGNGFVDLPLSNITYTYKGYTIYARDLFPTRSCSTQNYFYQLYTASYPYVAFLERYSYSTGTWETIDITSLNLKADVDKNSFSMAGGVDEIYLLYSKVDDEEGNSPAYISTFNENKGQWTHSVDVSEHYVFGSMIGLYQGQLILCGSDYYQDEEHVTEVYKIYPDTGVIYGSLPDIPIGYFKIWGAVGGNISTYGDKLIITDSKWTLDWSWSSFFRDNDWLSVNGPIIFDGTNWYEGDYSIFNTSSKATMVDPSQNFYDVGAACADAQNNLCDIVVGPVKNNGTAGMIDTWIYNSSRDQNNEDTDASAWEGRTDVRFNSFKTATLSGAVHDGKFYVNGKNGLDYDTTFRVLDLSKVGLQSIDTSLNAQHQFSDPGDNPQEDQSTTVATGDSNTIAFFVLMSLALTALVITSKRRAIKR